MKKEKNEITDLFRSRLVDAQMEVKEGFWEKLETDVSVACRQRHRALIFRIAAAASVLLVLGASSAVLWNFSPREDLGEAFHKIEASRTGSLNGDGLQISQLPQATGPVLYSPAPFSGGALPSSEKGGEDSLSVRLSVSFSFSSSTAFGGGGRSNQYTGYRKAANSNRRGDNSAFVPSESNSADEIPITGEQVSRESNWAIKAEAGFALPADEGAYKPPVSTGITVERRLNDFLSVETGLLYSNLRSDEQTLHYLGIPVRMIFLLADTEKFDLYASVGGMADKCFSGAPDNSFAEEPIQLAVTAGVGIRYKINDRLALFAEPGVSHHFQTDSKLVTARTKRPTNFNLLCGIRMTY